MKRDSVPPAVPAKDYLLKRLQDPATAAAYLNAAVEDDDLGAFLQALRNVTDAQGGIGRMASGNVFLDLGFGKDEAPTT